MEMRAEPEVAGFGVVVTWSEAFAGLDGGAGLERGLGAVCRITWSWLSSELLGLAAPGDCS